MPMTAREISLKTLSACRKSGSWSDTFLNNILNKENLDNREASLAAKICYGVLQNTALIDFYISFYSTVRPEKMEPMLLDILRLSVYQILFLTRIPHSAAVNEGVVLVKKYCNPRASSLANAVLRKISSNFDKLPLVPHDTIEEYLSIKYSHPKWLVHAFCQRLGQWEAEALLKANNSDVPVTAQINTLKTDIFAVISSLEADGVDIRPNPLLPGSIELRGTGNIERLSAFQNGYIFIQDIAARLAVEAAMPKPGTFLIDGCSAPGGKSFMAAVIMKNCGKILSCDIHEKKLNQILKSAERLGISIIATQAMDARVRYDALIESADTVICDVPCSGFGVIRKKT